ncbi:MAG: DUF1684 domain-containing protein [Ginsengibacter sp.]
MKRALRKFESVNLIMILFILCFQNTSAQIYKDSLLSYQQNYINNHEVVGKDDKKYIHFYPVDESYRVTATFKKKDDAKGFDMITASGKKQLYFRYGLLTFKLHNSLVHLYIYQSASLMKQEKYKDYLFVPFGDATSGFDSYGGGRYLDFTISDIKNNRLVIDFNKAYNPYCAYTAGYNCPIPPKENLLTIPIRGGEENYGKPVH